MATLQNSLAGINTPEIFWVLSGDDLTLDLNNPQEPKFLSIGNDPGLVDTYSPVVSLIISATLKLLNRPGQHHSIVLVDELPTLYIPNLDRVPATARKNKVATVLCVQDFSQLEDKYGEKKTEVIISVLANQFFGKTSNPKTGERISRIYGKYDQHFITEAESESRGRSSGGTFLGTANRSKSYSHSTTIQERPRVKPQDLVGLHAGEFYGTLVDSDRTELRGQFQESDMEAQEIEAFKIVGEDQVKEDSRRIKEEARAILEGRAGEENRDGG